MIKAGIGKCDITTDDENAEIRDPLYAKVLILNDGKTEILIITMDTVAIGARTISAGELPDVSDEFLYQLKTLAESKFGIPQNNILVNASHTHPPGRLLCSDDEQIKRILNTIKYAKENMVPVKIGMGKYYEDQIIINRTLRLKNGSHWTIRHTNPLPPDEEIEGLGPIDPEINILKIDRSDGVPLAIIYNFGVHLLFGDARGSITANFTEIASTKLEEILGRETQVMFTQGAGGDIIDIHFKDFECPRDIEPLADRLALGLLKSIKEIETADDITLNIISETIELPLRDDFDEKINKLKEEQKNLLASLRGTALNFKMFLPLYLKHKLFPKYPSTHSYQYLHEKKVGSSKLIDMDNFVKKHIDKYLQNIYAMEKLARIEDKIETLKKHKSIVAELGGSTISAEIIGIRIGSGMIISSPAELLAEIGLKIKQISPYKHTFTSAFSNGYLHYGAPASYYEKGGYEVTECLLAPEWEKVYLSKVVEIIHKL